MRYNGTKNSLFFQSSILIAEYNVLIKSLRCTGINEGGRGNPFVIFINKRPLLFLVVYIFLFFKNIDEAIIRKLKSILKEEGTQPLDQHAAKTP